MLSSPGYETWKISFKSSRQRPRLARELYTWCRRPLLEVACLVGLKLLGYRVWPKYYTHTLCTTDTQTHTEAYDTQALHVVADWPTTCFSQLERIIYQLFLKCHPSDNIEVVSGHFAILFVTITICTALCLLPATNVKRNIGDNIFNKLRTTTEVFEWL